MNKITIEKGTKLSMELWQKICEEILPKELPEQKDWRGITYDGIVKSICDIIEMCRENQIYDDEK